MEPAERNSLPPAFKFGLTRQDDVDRTDAALNVALRTLDATTVSDLEASIEHVLAVTAFAGWNPEREATSRVDPSTDVRGFQLLLRFLRGPSSSGLKRTWQLSAAAMVPLVAAGLLEGGMLTCVLVNGAADELDGSCISLLLSLPDRLMPLIALADEGIPQPLRPVLGIPSPIDADPRGWSSILTPGKFFALLARSAAEALWQGFTSFLQASLGESGSKGRPSLAFAAPTSPCAALVQRMVQRGLLKELGEEFTSLCFSRLLLLPADDDHGSTALGTGDAVWVCRQVMAWLVNTVGAACVAQDEDTADSNEDAMHHYRALARHVLPAAWGFASRFPIAADVGSDPAKLYRYREPWKRLVALLLLERWSLHPELCPPVPETDKAGSESSVISAAHELLMSDNGGGSGAVAVVSAHLRTVTLLACLFGSDCAHASSSAPASSSSQLPCFPSFGGAAVEAETAAGGFAASIAAVRSKDFAVLTEEGGSDAHSSRLFIGVQPTSMLGLQSQQLPPPASGDMGRLWLPMRLHAPETPSTAPIAPSNPSFLHLFVTAVTQLVLPSVPLPALLVRGVADWLLFNVLPLPLKAKASTSGPLASDVASVWTLPYGGLSGPAALSAVRLHNDTSAAVSAALAEAANMFGGNPQAVVAAAKQKERDSFAPVASRALLITSVADAATALLAGENALASILTNADGTVSSTEHAPGSTLRTHVATASFLQRQLGIAAATAGSGSAASTQGGALFTLGPKGAATSSFNTATVATVAASGAPPVLPLQELAARWASPQYAVSADTNAQLSFARLLVHCLTRLPGILLSPTGYAITSAIEMDKRLLVRTPALPFLFPTLTAGISVRMDNPSSVVRGSALRVAEAFSERMSMVTVEKRCMKIARGILAKEAGKEIEEAKDADESTLPTAMRIQTLSFQGDADVRDLEEDEQVRLADAADKAAAELLALQAQAATAAARPLDVPAQAVAEKASAAVAAAAEAGDRALPEPANGLTDGSPAQPNASAASVKTPAPDTDSIPPAPRISVRSYVYTGRAIIAEVPASKTKGSSADAANGNRLFVSPFSSSGGSANSKGGVATEALAPFVLPSHARLIEARQRKASAVKDQHAARDSAFLRKALHLASKAPLDLTGLVVTRREPGPLPLADNASSARGASSSKAIVAAGGDDGGVISVVDMLRSDTDYEGCIAALVTLPRLVRAMAGNLPGSRRQQGAASDYYVLRGNEQLMTQAPALLRTLLTLEDRFNLPDFGMWRFTAMVSIAASVLPLASQHLVHMLFSSDLSEGHRLEILDVVVAATREASGKDPAVIPETPWELAVKVWTAARQEKERMAERRQLKGGTGDGSPTASHTVPGRKSAQSALALGPVDPSRPGAAPAGTLSDDISEGHNYLAPFAASSVFYPLLRGILTGTPNPTMVTSTSSGSTIAAAAAADALGLELPSEISGAFASSRQTNPLSSTWVGGGAEASAPSSTAAGASIPPLFKSMLEGTSSEAAAASIKLAQCPKLIADSASSSVAGMLAQSLRALAVVLESTGVHSTAEGMARSLLAVAWGIRRHKDSGVRRACISCFAAVMACCYSNALLASASALFHSGSSLLSQAAGTGAGGKDSGVALRPVVTSLLSPELELGAHRREAAEPEIALLYKSTRTSTTAAAPKNSQNDDRDDEADDDDEGVPLERSSGAAAPFVTFEDVSTLPGPSDGVLASAVAAAVPLSSPLSSLKGVGRGLQEDARSKAALASRAAILGVSGKIRKSTTDRKLAEAAAQSLLTRHNERTSGPGGGAMTAEEAQDARMEAAAGEALVTALMNAGSPTLWEDLQEVVAFLCAVEVDDPDQDCRVLASAILNNEITRRLVLRPLEILQESVVGSGGIGATAGAGPALQLFAHPH